MRAYIPHQHVRTSTLVYTCASTFRQGKIDHQHRYKSDEHARFFPVHTVLERILLSKQRPRRSSKQQQQLAGGEEGNLLALTEQRFLGWMGSRKEDHYPGFVRSREPSARSVSDVASRKPFAIPLPLGPVVA